MSEFFAKRLPVDGEITWNGGIDEPIFYYDLRGEATLCVGHRLPNLEVKCTLDSGTVFYEGHGRFKKAKLHIVSNDIQAGDKVYCLRTARSGDGVEMRTAGKYYDTCQIKLHIDDYKLDTWGYINNQDIPQYIHYPEEMVKVIGQVSPKAIWVKDGDRFEQDEVKIIYKNQYQCLCEKPGFYRTPEQATCEHMVDDHRGGDFCTRKIQVVDYVEILSSVCNHFH